MILFIVAYSSVIEINAIGRLKLWTLYFAYFWESILLRKELIEWTREIYSYFANLMGAVNYVRSCNDPVAMQLPYV